jgi:hypothetical protein
VIFCMGLSKKLALWSAAGVIDSRESSYNDVAEMFRLRHCDRTGAAAYRQLTSAGAKYLVRAQERPRGKCSAGSLGAVLTTAHRDIL